MNTKYLQYININEIEEKINNIRLVNPSQVSIMNINEENKPCRLSQAPVIDNSIELISVIVPVYNGEQYLPQFLESLINQTYENFEIIFGYDVKSTDNSLEILRDFQKAISKQHTVLIDEGSDNGAGGGRNRGLSLSKGTYVVFADADDYLMPQYLEYLHEAFVLYPEIGVSCCRCIMLLPEMDIKTELLNADILSKHVIHVHNKDEMISSYMHMSLFDYSANDIITSPASWLYMVKKSVLLSNNHIYLDSKLKKGGVIEDLVWVIQLLCSVDKFAHTSKVLYMYRTYGNSTIGSADNVEFLRSFDATFKYIGHDLSAVNLQFTSELRNMHMPFIVFRAAFTTTYESWKEFLREAFNISPDEKDLDKSLESVKMISVNPASQIDNLLINQFNMDKHRCYVLIRHGYNVLSKRWRLYPLVSNLPPLSDEEIRIAHELEETYPQYLKE